MLAILPIAYTVPCKKYYPTHVTNDKVLSALKNFIYMQFSVSLAANALFSTLHNNIPHFTALTKKSVTI